MLTRVCLSVHSTVLMNLENARKCHHENFSSQAMWLLLQASLTRASEMDWSCLNSASNSNFLSLPLALLAISNNLERNLAIVFSSPMPTVMTFTPLSLSFWASSTWKFLPCLSVAWPSVKRIRTSGASGRSPPLPLNTLTMISSSIIAHTTNIIMRPFLFIKW